MAQNRLNKVASIFTRLNGLLKANIMPWTDRPIWYDVYKTFPPIRDPTYRSIAGASLDEYPPLPPKIFYEEDKIRAYYFKELGPIENQVLNSNIRKTLWDIFIDVYNELEKKGITRKGLVQATYEEMLLRGYLVNQVKKATTETSESGAEEEMPNITDFQAKLKNIIKDLEAKKPAPIQN